LNRIAQILILPGPNRNCWVSEPISGFIDSDISSGLGAIPSLSNDIEEAVLVQITNVPGISISEGILEGVAVIRAVSIISHSWEMRSQHGAKD
jgi:hypothetical protein